MMVACVFTSVRKKEIRQFSTMTEDILQLVSWLTETDCEMAAMESTGSYWKSVYNIFEEEHIPIMVVNAQHIKGVPGCKTDVKDAEWIGEASYIPSQEQRELREITRYRREIIESYDFSDKKIVLFATSGGSGIEKIFVLSYNDKDL